jgi:dihydroorotase
MSDRGNGLLVKGGRLFDPGSGVDGIGDVLVRDGVIAESGEVAEGQADEVINAAGLWVLPGLMDMHVHLREPGQEHKETTATGTQAAVAGGFTAVACEPNTVPPCDSAARLAAAMETAERTAVARVLPKCAITLGQKGRELTDLEALCAAGAVAASDDGASVEDGEVMRAAILSAKQVGLPLTLHVDGPAMVERDIGLAAEAGWRVHFSHVSLAEEVGLIAEARAKGLHVSGEATPHHLALTADDAPVGNADFKMNPPLATARDVAALRSALADGVLTVIASDHAPHAPTEKGLRYEEAPPGVIGLETTLAVVWTRLVEAGTASPETTVRALTSGPAEVLGLSTPSLRKGAPADITLFDPKRSWVVEPRHFKSKGRNCPFAGDELRGKVVGTIVDGRVAMREGSILEAGAA